MAKYSLRIINNEHEKKRKKKEQLGELAIILLKRYFGPEKDKYPTKRDISKLLDRGVTLGEIHEVAGENNISITELNTFIKEVLDVTYR